MAPQSIPNIKNIIRKISVTDVEKMMGTLLQQASVEDMQRIIMDAYGDLLHEDIYAE